MATFWLICGMSGAGKTTFAHQIFGPPHNDTVLVDVDEYYKKINGDECDRSNSYKVWMAVYDKIHECEINDQDVALVTNALTVANREEFVEWFPTFNHKMIFFLADLKDCKKYNAQRNRVIPEHLMDKYWNSMEIPNPAEKGWTTIMLVVNRFNGDGMTIQFLKEEY